MIVDREAQGKRRANNPGDSCAPADTLSAMPSLGARIIAYGFLGIICAAGPFMLLLDVVTGIQRVGFIHSAIPAEGVIVGLGRPAGRKQSYRGRFPVFQFTTQGGASFTVYSNISQSPPPWKFGERVPVLYRQRHPQDAHIDSFVQLWGPQVVLTVVGGAFSTIPLLIVRGRRRAKISKRATVAGE
ncbi:MAG TPA: DUF3592 domain-containing protein [Acidobacteriaceae bacterium]|nr:DUF3592 domain-containing protein [Acidobacteriaceae bacterium]